MATTTSSIEFFVTGKPATQGSKVGFPHSKTGKIIMKEDNPRLKSWRYDVGMAAQEVFGDKPLITGPVRLGITFYLQRPKAHYRTGKNKHLLKDSAPSFPIVMPDLTKMLRAAEDALKGVIWKDDSQVIAQETYKAYIPLDQAQGAWVRVLVI